jgi:DNA-binding Xre family transcriptional regulator
MVYSNLFKTLETKGLTNQALVDIAKLSYGTVFKIHEGLNVPMGVIEKICNSIDCSPSDVFEYINLPEITRDNSNHEHYKQDIYQCDKKGNIIQRFHGPRDAGRKLGKQHSAISECLNGNRKTAYGSIWKYAAEVCHQNAL